VNDKVKEIITNRLVSLVANNRHLDGAFFNQLTVDGLVENPVEVLDLVHKYFPVKNSVEILSGIWSIDCYTSSVANKETLIWDLIGQLRSNAHNIDHCEVVRNNLVQLMNDWLTMKSESIYTITWNTRPVVAVSA